MSAYKDLLAIERDAPKVRLELAKEILTHGNGAVLLEGVLVLRKQGGALLCEVIDPDPLSRRCANEYEVLLENAQRLLRASKLMSLLPVIPQVWLVVEDYGTIVAT